MTMSEEIETLGLLIDGLYYDLARSENRAENLKTTIKVLKEKLKIREKIR